MNTPNHPIENIFPFPALAGQESLKLALCLLAVDPGLGGVLLVGDKGTAKSTAARGLAEILPHITAFDCPFHCYPPASDELCPECRKRLDQGERLPSRSEPPPFLTLPLGATEDRVVGGLDLEASMKAGRPMIQPGLLGQANRGFLYIDEVNLLDPHLAHLLLDAAETGFLRVEREGLSVRHPARVTLIGSMNPEEGALGPQLADRFALTVRVASETDPTIRAEIVRRRLAFEVDPAGFRSVWGEDIQNLRNRVGAARSSLANIRISDAARRQIDVLVHESRAAGHRADLAFARAGRALAAWRSDAEVTKDHIQHLADMILTDRARPEEKRPVSVRIAAENANTPYPHAETPILLDHPFDPPFLEVPTGESDLPLVERLQTANSPFEIVTPTSRREQGAKDQSGRRSARKTEQARGRYYRASMERLGRPPALDATLRAAAPYQNDRRSPETSGFIIRSHDLREKVFRRKTGRLIVFLVDASGSVGALDRMAEAKAAAISLLRDAYRKRDRVGLISFHGREATVLVPPTNSVETASRLLDDLPTGGKTPMAAALAAAHKLIRRELLRDPGLTPLTVILTDGRPNVPLEPGVDPWREVLSMARGLGEDRRLRFLVVDTDQGYYNDYKLIRDLADNLNAPRLTLEDLRAGRLEALLETVF